MNKHPSVVTSASVSFADIAHGSLLFDRRDSADQLVLDLLDTRWVQRLRQIRQTGNTSFVYMFSEHSRFGHSLGVAYLAKLLLAKLSSEQPDVVDPYRSAVMAAALLHDVGHVAPGSHLAEHLWHPSQPAHHEEVTERVVREDLEIRSLLQAHDSQLVEQVSDVLAGNTSVPAWTHEVLAGSGWNADRGNWSIVDSTLCAVTYGRYNVQALIDAFLISSDGHLVVHEKRLDALTHFFVARDSMYRQVYQHRVLQAADALSMSIVRRLRDLVASGFSLTSGDIFCDEVMRRVLTSNCYSHDLELDQIFWMTEAWWNYHIACWCSCSDPILADLARRQRDRKLLKTIRLDLQAENLDALTDRAAEAARTLGYDPRYYVMIIDSADKHRRKSEPVPLVQLDNGQTVPVTEVEPLIATLASDAGSDRCWLAVPGEVKEQLQCLR